MTMVKDSTRHTPGRGWGCAPWPNASSGATDAWWSTRRQAGGSGFRRGCGCARRPRSQHDHSHGLRILIADDHEGVRHELCETLAREADVQVVADESNGRDAVLRVHALRPHGLDLVLMDIDMPVMNGIDATAEILATDPSLPVISLTVSILHR